MIRGMTSRIPGSCRTRFFQSGATGYLQRVRLSRMELSGTKYPSPRLFRLPLRRLLCGLCGKKFLATDYGEVLPKGRGEGENGNCRVERKGRLSPQATETVALQSEAIAGDVFSKPTHVQRARTFPSVTTIRFLPVITLVAAVAAAWLRGLLLCGTILRAASSITRGIRS